LESDETVSDTYGIASWRGEKIIMKRRLQIIGKIFLVLFWALRFRIFRLVRFVRNYLIIERSGLFDAEFYGKTLTLVHRNHGDPYPLVHYLARGASEARDPDPLFNTVYYLAQNPDVADAGSNPLIHYIKYGVHEDRNPHPLFNTAYYLKQYPDVVAAGLNPLAHYLECGARENRNPHTLFDTAYYFGQCPDVRAAGLNPLIHYLKCGAHECRNPNRMFDTAYYLKEWPDVAESGLNPLVHYLEYGAFEDRKPNALFDSAYYRNRYVDVLEKRINPLVHYLEHGAQEDRKPNPLFDTAYYMRQYPDVVESGLNPLAHYLECGAYQDRKPNPLFDTAYYMRQYPDVVESGLNPLAHYLKHGALDGRKPSPLFDTAYYRRQYPDVVESGLNPLAHYLERGAFEDRKPNALFYSAYYLSIYGDVVETGMNPLVHYLEYGAQEKRKPNPLFETAYYLKQYPDVVETGLNPLVHYLEYGALDGRKPNPLFDTAYYLRAYPDALEKGLNPLAHYLESGALEGRKPNPLFDSAYYLDMNPDVAETGVNPLVHYLLFGVREGRKPNPLFDTKYYLEKNPEVVATSENPLVHYLEKGAAEGRNPGPDFDTAYYLEMSPDVAHTGGNALIHYLEYGIREGRYPNNVYELWVQENRLTDADRKRMLEHIDALSYRPTFSLIVPVYNTDERWLRRCLDSVLAQLYPDWELCIADDASTEPTVRRLLEEYKSRDARIHVVFRLENGHISASSNSALEIATGEFIALLDHDDELPEQALYENAVLLNEHKDADMIYSDEDKLNEDGQRHSPFFKPDWSPDTFLSHMYTCHLGVYRTELVRTIGGFRVGYEGSQDYDLVLRLTEKTERIYHISKILYHWRAIHGSTALTYNSKNYAYKAGLKAIREALDRRQEGGRVEHVVHYPGQYLVHYPVVGRPLVSIVIPTKDHPQALNQCLNSIFSKTSYNPFEVIIVDNGSVEDETLNLLTSWKNKEHGRLKVIRLDIPFNYSRLINEGVRQAAGALVVLLNDDAEVISEGWLEEMAGQAQRQSIGAVGAFLFYPDRTLQHAGLILGIVGPANHVHRFAREDSPGYFGRLLIVANYAAVTGACLMVKKQLFIEAGGLDEDLAVAYNDVDFCLRLLKMGYRNVVLPQVRLFHHESRSRGSDRTGENRVRLGHEAGIMKKRWAAMIQNDPYYNPNLTRDREDFTLGFFSVKR
jgi:O-antigen biosynthesis protein